MDLKVSVEGVIREVSGVTESTTCEEIIIKLAQAANLPGFYTLVAVYRGREDTLSADEKMVDFFRNLHEKPSNVQFILRRLEAPSPRPTQSQIQAKKHPSVPTQRSQSRLPANLHYHDMSSGAFHGPFSPPPTWNSGREQSTPAQKRPSLRRSATFEAKQVAQDARTPNSSQTAFDSDEYEQLKDQLAYQEQEVELNRIRLLRLDKEIAELEHANRLAAINDASLPVGPAAELAQLAATPWSQLLDANRARQRDLLKEHERYKLALERINTELEKTRKDALQFENKTNQELERLLATLDVANSQRRQLLRSLSPPAARTRPSASNTSDGVAV
ncbi:Ras association domain-containing protein 8 [Clonorchis sinensis]|uniref:Ras association domain-containing protein 8 n=1 Tax=Clonorchis sinensis TaxID=79923 RepID=A0A3R7DA31_CLOSI|nr:Ras association domain-containing protein 8 [Clonorchis sinensis]